ncbi:UDP-N-acetylmuramoylalanine--D-glutamate ligase [Striga asiatica]|uniref:UDP-N-acetylmuramoylalanine--D-glutamate ligase n=1 Tax=Striga asiatica TaxID=4170 RepID=A0A5A7P3A9_STRAF|nr:UDP-N-acetylmuramoylalanine--D-glutamate ligase [Striga asiatica]
MHILYVLHKNPTKSCLYGRYDRRLSPPLRRYGGASATARFSSPPFTALLVWVKSTILPLLLSLWLLRTSSFTLNFHLFEFPPPEMLFSLRPSSAEGCSGSGSGESSASDEDELEDAVSIVVPLSSINRSLSGWRTLGRPEPELWPTSPPISFPSGIGDDDSDPLVANAKSQSSSRSPESASGFRFSEIPAPEVFIEFSGIEFSGDARGDSGESGIGIAVEAGGEGDQRTCLHFEKTLGNGGKNLECVCVLCWLRGRGKVESVVNSGRF